MFHMKHKWRLLVSGLLAGIALILFLDDVLAQEPPHAYGSTWPNPCLTHSGVSELDAMVGPALDAWGETSSVADCGAGGDILIRYSQEDIGPAAAWAATSFFEGGPITFCEIGVSPGVDLSHPIAQHIIEHEVGHCLGLGHPSESGVIVQSVMNGGVYGLTDFDHEAIAALYPPGVIGEPAVLHRLVLPGLAR